MEIFLRLIDSKSKASLLQRLLERPNAVFSVSELGRLSGLPKSSVSAIVAQWEGSGLALSRQQGRNKLVSINPKFHLLPELRKIFEKTGDFQKPLISELKSMRSLKSPQVRAVVVFGSRARNDFSYASDLDVLVGVEDKNSPITERIVEEFAQASKRTGVRFSPVLLEKKEIMGRWKEKDRFIHNILAEGKIMNGGKWLGHLQAAP